MSERSQREGFRPGCYGPVQINGGDHEGKIGYYDDDDEPGIAIVDPGDFFVAEGYYLIPFKYLFPATVHALIERRQELMGYIFDITHQDGIHDEDYRELYKLMSELHYVDLQIADINFHGRFGKQTSKGKNLFISYSSKDKGYAMQVHDDLKSLGHNPWIDSIDIAAGESIPAKIQDSIDKSDFVIVLMSENSVNSKWVEIEWVTKFWKDVENKNVHVIPAKISDCVVPPLLKTKKYADFTDNYENGLYELLKGIGH